MLIKIPSQDPITLKHKVNLIDIFNLEYPTGVTGKASQIVKKYEIKIFLFENKRFQFFFCDAKCI